MGKGVGFLQESHLTPARLDQARRLDEVARGRGQSLAQLALAWLLKDPRVTSVLIGASKPNQLMDSLRCLAAAPFSPEELAHIEQILQRPPGAGTSYPVGLNGE